MRNVWMVICFVLMSQAAFCSDSLTVDFQGSFHLDSVSLIVNDKLVYQGILTTNVIAGLAESITIPGDNNKYYHILIKSKECISQFRFKKKWKYLGIKFSKTDCKFYFELARKGFAYL